MDYERTELTVLGPKDRLWDFVHQCLAVDSTLPIESHQLAVCFDKILPRPRGFDASLPARPLWATVYDQRSPAEYAWIPRGARADWTRCAVYLFLRTWPIEREQAKSAIAQMGNLYRRYMRNQNAYGYADACAWNQAHWGVARPAGQLAPAILTTRAVSTTFYTRGRPEGILAAVRQRFSDCTVRVERSAAGQDEFVAQGDYDLPQYRCEPTWV